MTVGPGGTKIMKMVSILEKKANALKSWPR